MDRDGGAARPNVGYCIKGSALRKFVLKHLLPISLLLGIAFAVIWPWPGVQFGTKVDGVSPTREIAIMIIFLCSGLKLTTDAVKEALSAWVGLLWGMTSILFITVMVGLELTQLVTFPDDLVEFRIGLVVFFAMPTTVSSGIVLTQQANGNYAVALFLTVASIIIAPFTIPLMLAWRADLGEGVELDAEAMIIKMCYRLIAPLAVGKALRNFAAVRNFVKKYKWSLKVLGIYCLVSMPWVTASQAMDNGGLDKITVVGMCVLLPWAIGMHVVFLIMNYTACRLLQLDLPVLKAVVILASQKTLPISIVVIDALPEAAGEKSLMQMACITAHLSQIIVDSWAISSVWSGEDKKRSHGLEYISDLLLHPMQGESYTLLAGEATPMPSPEKAPPLNPAADNDRRQSAAGAPTDGANRTPASRKDLGNHPESVPPVTAPTGPRGSTTSTIIPGAVLTASLVRKASRMAIDESKFDQSARSLTGVGARAQPDRSSLTLHKTTI
jgi:sodium/bile acid cotransporter 7